MEVGNRCREHTTHRWWLQDSPIVCILISSKDSMDCNYQLHYNTLYQDIQS